MSILESLNRQLNIPLEFSDDTTVAHLVSKHAFIHSKEQGKSPRQLADEIVAGLKTDSSVIKKIEVAGAGFINIFLTDVTLLECLETIGAEQHQTPQVRYWAPLQHKKVVFEYTDPNPFKVFHIGHLMPNLVGQAFSNIFEYLGADVKRVNYQGDVGMHVAKSIYGIIKLGGIDQVKTKSLQIRAEFLGKAYVIGTNDYESDESAKLSIIRINKAVYKIARDNLLDSKYQNEKLDFGKVDKSINLDEVQKIYLTGRSWSLEKFEEIYKRLGTKFDHYYFESTAGIVGAQVVKQGLEKGVFEKSDGAVVFKGEKYGLHTRVFINSEGLPTYEAKDLGLPSVKQKDFDYDLSVIITGNEIDEYFKVVLKALFLLDENLSNKTKHISHGMLKLITGKMSSRKGNIISGEELLNSVHEQAVKKVDESMKVQVVEGKYVYSNDDEQNIDFSSVSNIAEIIAQSAIKYSVLKVSTGKDIIFNPDKELMFEGNTGPYLQYTAVRANSILNKLSSTLSGDVEELLEQEIKLILKLSQFNDAVLKCAENYSIHYLSNYLYQLASSFNGYYATTKIDEGENTKQYRVDIASKVSQTLTMGLSMLGIKVPAKM